jgi:hypothetical protein
MLRFCQGNQRDPLQNLPQDVDAFGSRDPRPDRQSREDRIDFAQRMQRAKGVPLSGAQESLGADLMVRMVRIENGNQNGTIEKNVQGR